MDFQTEEKIFVTIIAILLSIMGLLIKKIIDYEKRDNELIRTHGEDVFSYYSTIFPDLYEEKDFTIKAYNGEN